MAALLLLCNNNKWRLVSQLMFSSLVLSLSLVHILNVYLLLREANRLEKRPLSASGPGAAGWSGHGRGHDMHSEWTCGRPAAPPELAGAAQLWAAVSVNFSCRRDTTFAFNLSTSLIHCKKSCSSTPASGDAGPIHTGVEKSFRHPWRQFNEKYRNFST